MQLSLRLAAALVFLLLPGMEPGAQAQGKEGFAQYRKVVGGEGGKVFKVRTAHAFIDAVGGNPEERRIVVVQGTIDFGEATVSSYRTIVGDGPNAKLIGNLEIRPRTISVIVRNLHITNPQGGKVRGEGDGITIKGAQRVWIDHCTFSDCADGCIDIKNGADSVTVSWCKFYYTDQPEHRFTMLAMGSEEKKGKRLHITLHHNWWAENCESRMPAARNADVHMYNNYFSCQGNSYCSNARPRTELLSENNYYEKVKNPCYAEGGASLKTKGNIYDRCTGKAERRNDDVFTPPYAYTLDATQDVPGIVKAGAGPR